MSVASPSVLPSVSLVARPIQWQSTYLMRAANPRKHTLLDCKYAWGLYPVPWCFAVEVGRGVMIARSIVAQISGEKTCFRSHTPRLIEGFVAAAGGLFRTDRHSRSKREPGQADCERPIGEASSEPDRSRRQRSTEVR